MKYIVYSASNSFKRFFSGLVESDVIFRSDLSLTEFDNSELIFLHISSYGKRGFSWLKDHAVKENLKIVMCSNQPDLREMLDAVRFGVKAYCNSYMQSQYYNQLIKLVENGQSWFPPEMLSQTFELAHKSIHGNNMDILLSELTAREKDIASLVAEGLSNKKIAEQFSITEPTVKAHLTNIFKKLQLKDRVALILYMKKS